MKCELYPIDFTEQRVSTRELPKKIILERQSVDISAIHFAIAFIIVILFLTL